MILKKDQILLPSFEKGLNILIKDINLSEKEVRKYIEELRRVPRPEDIDKMIRGMSHSVTSVSGTRFPNPSQNNQKGW